MDSEKIMEILLICQSYESGFNHGIAGMNPDYNHHTDASTEFIAWNIGYSNGCENSAPEHPNLEEIH
jgi:hypothetical protein